MLIPENLSTEEKARFEWALAEFNRIQERNTEPGNGNTTIAPAISPLIKHVPNPQSRLFKRLLQGKSPLLFPPPTTYSNPWYELIEDGFSDSVFLDNFLDLHGKGPNTGILINQCVWNISYQNAAAIQLRELRKNISNERSLILTPQESREAKAILQGNPEWIVRHGRNPEFRLYLSRVKRKGRQNLLLTDLLQRDFSGGNPVLIEKLVKESGKSESSDIFTDNKSITGTSAYGAQVHNWVRVECDGWCLEVAN